HGNPRLILVAGFPLSRSASVRSARSLVEPSAELRITSRSNMSAAGTQDQEHDDIMYPDVLPFLLLHAGCIAAIWSGISWQAIAICVALYGLRMFAIGAGYHRYFSHRAYTT